MVAFKKLFLATSLLLSRVATAPYPAGTLAVTAASSHVVEESTIEASGLSNIEAQNRSKRNANTPKSDKSNKSNKSKTLSTPSTPNPISNKSNAPNTPNTPNKSNTSNQSTTKCLLPQRGSLNRRVLNTGNDASKITETEMVGREEIVSNNKQAKVVDLSGCTALFFYMNLGSRGHQLRRAVHITCGQEEIDAPKAANAAAGADSVTIGASTAQRYEATKAAIKAVKPNMEVNDADKVIYINAGLPAGTAITLTAAEGSTKITKGTSPQVRKQSQC